MSVQNPDRLATKQDLKDMYDRIRPYMGGLVTSKAGFTPVGTVISVMGTTAPVNYLACDGTVYNIADYTELANYFNEQFGSTNFFGGDGTTTFAVPDLRGEFLRGTGTNSHTNQGSGASVGVHQDATEHIHVYAFKNNSIGVYSNDSSGNYYELKSDSEITEQNASKNISTSANFNENASLLRFTSRPTNTSVLYCIATKNFYIDPTLDYSTDEKVVGTWIDGKPLWQVTLEFSNVLIKSNYQRTNVGDLSSLNIDCGWIVDVQTIEGTKQYFESMGYILAAIDNTDNSIVLIHALSSVQTTYNKMYVTLQYTKATT